MAPHGSGLSLGRKIAASWFALDAVVALAPPLYWAADGATAPILGLPGALFYFVAVSAFIAASVVFAWAVGEERAA